MPEGEWDAFVNCLRRPLPVTFRINGSGRFADHLRDKLQSDFFSHFGKDTLLVRAWSMHTVLHVHGVVACAVGHARHSLYKDASVSSLSSQAIRHLFAMCGVRNCPPYACCQVDGEPVSPPRPLPWYPNNYAWHMDFSRGQLRKVCTSTCRRQRGQLCGGHLRCGVLNGSL